jgi:hypothetical protein
MSTRSKHPSRTRTKRKNQSNLAVMPVAVKTDSRSREAMIPATVNCDSGEAEAVISVEVKSRGKQRKRAAVIPVAVEEHSTEPASYSNDKSHARTFRKYPVPLRTFLSDNVNTLAHLEQDGARLLIGYGRLCVAALQFVFWPFLGDTELRTERDTVGGKVLPWTTRTGRTTPARAA